MNRHSARIKTRRRHMGRKAARRPGAEFGRRCVKGGELRSARVWLCSWLRPVCRLAKVCTRRSTAKYERRGVASWRGCLWDDAG